MKIGILTGGGDCPGLNAVIRAIVRKGIFHHNDQFVGFMEGWRGVLVEVIGREGGWIAIYSGVAGGADVILIPEQPFDIQEIAETIKNRHDRRRYFSIIVVAEGGKLANRAQDHERRKTDEFGHVR